MTDERRPAHHLDDTAITWRPFPVFGGLSFWVLGVNDVRQKVDIFFRMAPYARCPVHRHVGPTDTLVVEGEHRTYARRADGWELDEVRAPGFFASNEGDHLHTEEGGPDGTILMLSMTAVDGVIWEVQADDGIVLDTATIGGFRHALERQRQQVTPV